MKKNLLFLILFFVSTTVMAQDFPYGTASQQEIDMIKYDKDTSAHAVVLNEYGSSRMRMIGMSLMVVVYDYHVKIKFFDQKNFNKGTIEIPITYGRGGNPISEIRNLKGITSYKDENGLIETAELDTGKTYEVKRSNRLSFLKFAMPAMRNGCVIEYSYKLITPYNGDLPGWYFQSDIPTANSTYEAHIPSPFTYNALLKGPLKLTKSEAKIERMGFLFNGVYNDCSYLTYNMTDVPAFVEDIYMTSRLNFLSAIDLELSSYNLVWGSTTNIATNWKDIDRIWKEDESFGLQLKKSYPSKNTILTLISNKADELEKAKAIYSFIQKTFKWNKVYSAAAEFGIEKALNKHTGDIGDINLSLISALNVAGIKAEAVLISTRDQGVLTKIYPTLDDFNYVIVGVTINDKTYFLDATDPLLGFGMIPLKCLNGPGRAFSLNKPSYWIDLINNQKETNTYNIDLTLLENGKIKGSITHYSSGYAAYEKRYIIKKFNSADEYIEDWSTRSNKFKILKSEITNLDSLDMPLTETYEIEIDAYTNTVNQLAFDPYIIGKIIDNPFKLNERTYPVDYGMPSDLRCSLTMHLPDKYAIEVPKDVAFRMPDKGGNFSTTLESEDNSFTFSYIVQFNKSIYEPEEYPYLKELFNKIILQEKSPVIIKKKS